MVCPLFPSYFERRGIPVAIDAARGKGSHQTVYFGARYTVLRSPTDERTQEGE
jgi:hypothetical protein